MVCICGDNYEPMVIRIYVTCIYFLIIYLKGIAFWLTSVYFVRFVPLHSYCRQCVEGLLYLHEFLLAFKFLLWVECFIWMILLH